MEKVKVTQEQAEAIKHALNPENKMAYANNPDELLKAHVRSGTFATFLSPLNGLDVSELAKALYIGYEVEPEFNEGDYVMVKWMNRQKEEFYRVVSIDPRGTIQIETFDGAPNSSGYGNTRHATESEIAAEKERRWWSKHGRGVWELREGDLLVGRSKLNTGDIKIVEASDDSGTLLVNGYVDDFVENKEVLKEKYKVVAFAKNRLDVKTDD